MWSDALSSPQSIHADWVNIMKFKWTECYQWRAPKNNENTLEERDDKQNTQIALLTIRCIYQHKIWFNLINHNIICLALGLFKRCVSKTIGWEVFVKTRRTCMTRGHSVSMTTWLGKEPRVWISLEPLPKWLHVYSSLCFPHVFLLPPSLSVCWSSSCSCKVRSVSMFSACRVLTSDQLIQRSSV